MLKLSRWKTILQSAACSAVYAWVTFEFQLGMC